MTEIILVERGGAGFQNQCFQDAHGALGIFTQDQLSARVEASCIGHPVLSSRPLEFGEG